MHELIALLLLLLLWPRSTLILLPTVYVCILALSYPFIFLSSILNCLSSVLSNVNSLSHFHKTLFRVGLLPHQVKLKYKTNILFLCFYWFWGSPLKLIGMCHFMYAYHNCFIKLYLVIKYQKHTSSIFFFFHIDNGIENFTHTQPLYWQTVLCVWYCILCKYTTPHGSKARQ